ncbi:MAG: Na/Pi cotransporter family protein, partial [Lachnospiraceae bacterium]|nr:Na/Pi cotransporter family protein [Lachnospiraceae bacterium]
RHIKRLRKGKCTIELGLILQDLITNFERVSDHCSNIAVCLIETTEDGIGAHGYVHELKQNDERWFHDAIYVLRDKYMLPDSALDEEETVVAVPVIKEKKEKSKDKKKKSKDGDKKKEKKKKDK